LYAQVPRKTDEQKANDAAKRAFIIQRTADYQTAITVAAAKDPIQILANRVRKGPLMLLKKVYDKTDCVDIVLRHTHGVRGVMRATLFGFDKYFNMLLGDIHEVFVTRQRVTRITRAADAVLHPGDADGEGGAAEPTEQRGQRTRTAWKQVLKQRKLSRLVLKGDQVVMVYRVDGNMRLPGSLGVRFQDQCDRWTAP
jgi:small nuclear ribonucleoprotein (snRNP)-like protein